MKIRRIGVATGLCLGLLCSLVGQAQAQVQVRVVTDATGTGVSVPSKVQRPLALSEMDLDALLALELQPVGTTAGRGQPGSPNYLGEQGRRVPLIGGFSSPILDKVIQAKPDLILAGGVSDPQLLQQLRRIAPTLVTYTVGQDWKTAFTQIAHGLHQESQARVFFERYQQRVAQLQRQLGPRLQSTVSIVRWNPQGPAYMQREAFASLVLKDLGLQRPATQQQQGIAHSPPLSLEALQHIDADWLFIGTLSPTGQASDALKASLQRPVFQQLKAVRNQQMRMVDGSLWTSLGGPLAALAILNDIEKHLIPNKP